MVKVVALCVLCAWAGVSRAEPTLDPFLDVQWGVALETDLSSAEAGSGPEAGLTAEAELGLALQLAPRWSIELGAVFEPVRDSAGDNVFGPHGARVEALALRWQHQAARLWLGKFTPRFGVAWEVAPGLYGSDWAEDYELSERWGIGGEVGLPFDEASGEHRLSAEVFTADTSVLAGSLGGRRPRLRRADGGPGNTGRLDSLVVSLASDGFPGRPRLGTRISFLHHGRGNGDRRTERGFALAVERPVSVRAMGGWAWVPFFEFVQFWGRDGKPGDARYYTAALSALRGRWAMAASVSLRDLDRATGAETLFQAGLGYAFGRGVRLEVGAQATRGPGAGAGFRLLWEGDFRIAQLAAPRSDSLR